MLRLAAALLVVGLALVLYALPAQNAVGMGAAGRALPANAISRLGYGTFTFYGGGGCPIGLPKCVNGDTFFNTWADDDKIYTLQADVFDGAANGGWNNVGGNRNIYFSTITGFTTAATGTVVNSMDNFGTSTQIGSDGANYKYSGLISVNGTLIASVIRAKNTSAPVGFFSAQLVKSSNHGTTWAPQPPSTAQPYATPTFADPKFRCPFFFQYGKDYQGQTADRSGEFVYAMSADQSAGHTDPAGAGGNDQMTLGRVAIATMANPAITDATGWQYYQGGDGMLDASWGALATAAAVMATPGSYRHIFAGPPVYLSYYGRYLMSIGYGDTDGLIWQNWEAAHPWGPWTLMQVDRWGPSNPQSSLNAYNFYLPAAVVKSLATDGGRNIVYWTTGTHVVSWNWYTMFFVPVTVSR